MVNIGNSWDNVLKDYFGGENYQNLRRFLAEEYRTHTIYPDMHHIFSALKETAFEDVKVVIIGQDPYHNPGQAHGMCFSVMPGTDTPPSLVNVFKDVQTKFPPQYLRRYIHVNKDLYGIF